MPERGAGVLTSRAPGPRVWLLQGGIQVRQPTASEATAERNRKGECQGAENEWPTPVPTPWIFHLTFDP